MSEFVLSLFIPIPSTQPNISVYNSVLEKAFGHDTAARAIPLSANSKSGTPSFADVREYLALLRSIGTKDLNSSWKNPFSPAQEVRSTSPFVEYAATLWNYMVFEQNRLLTLESSRDQLKTAREVIRNLKALSHIYTDVCQQFKHPFFTHESGRFLCAYHQLIQALCQFSIVTFGTSNASLKARNALTCIAEAGSVRSALDSCASDLKANFSAFLNLLTIYFRGILRSHTGDSLKSQEEYGQAIADYANGVAILRDRVEGCHFTALQAAVSGLRESLAAKEKQLRDDNRKIYTQVVQPNPSALPEGVALTDLPESREILDAFGLDPGSGGGAHAPPAGLWASGSLAVVDQARNSKESPRAPKFTPSTATEPPARPEFPVPGQKPPPSLPPGAYPDLADPGPPQAPAPKPERPPKSSAPKSGPPQFTPPPATGPAQASAPKPERPQKASAPKAGPPQSAPSTDTGPPPASVPKQERPQKPSAPKHAHPAQEGPPPPVQYPAAPPGYPMGDAGYYIPDYPGATPVGYPAAEPVVYPAAPRLEPQRSAGAIEPPPRQAKPDPKLAQSTAPGKSPRQPRSDAKAPEGPPVPAVSPEDVGPFPMWYVARGYRDDNAKRIQTLKRSHPAAKDALAVYEQALQQADANDKEIEAAIRDCRKQKRAQDETVSEMIARALYFYDSLSLKLDEIENA
jgi:hypothetical protein